MRQANDQMLTHLIMAMDAQRAVKIRYVKENGEVSRRSIEIHYIKVTSAGNVTIECHDRKSGERHSFRVDRITHYTLHRSERLAWYQVPVVANDEPILDEDTAEVAGFRSWDYKYALAA
jgi:predicted DNA-binding transcriptional regulator YafY